MMTKNCVSTFCPTDAVGRSLLKKKNQQKEVSMTERWTLLRRSFMLLVCAVFCAVTMKAQSNKLPETSTADAPKYYVIQNCETLLFMQYKGHGISDYMKMSTTVDNACLWYFEGSTSVEDGTKIVTKAGLEDGASYKYLTSTEYSLNRIGKYSADGSTFYIHKNPTDMIGCVVSTTAGAPASGMAKCMEEYGSNEVALNDLGGGEDFKWIFKSYEDLLEDAQANGIDISSYENLDQTNAANFQSLISAINTAKDNKVVKTMDSGKKYLLRNRRYGYYLNANGLMFAGASTPTDYSTWIFTNVGGTPTLTNRDAANGTAIRLNTSAGNNQYFSLDPSVNQAFNATVIASSDGDQRYIAFQGVTIRSGLTNRTYYMAMVSSLTVEGRKGQSFSSDWEYIEAEEDVNYDKVIASDVDLIPEDENPLKATFFRIRNVGRSVEKYDADQFDGGGWLEDVDHTHAEYRLSETSSTAAMWVQEEAELMYAAKDAEVYAAMPDMTHASALWEFIRVGRASADNENATGVISPEHNIFIIRNANTGKYINGLAVANNGFYDVNLTTNSAEAAMFYLTTLIDGQMALNVYAGTEYSGSNAGKDAKMGVLGVTETQNGYHGGLTFLANTDAVKNTNSAWLIKPATTLQLNIMTTGTDDGYEWSTIYYPFDVKPADMASGREIAFFNGGWAKEPDYSGEPAKVGVIQMNEVQDVPAGNAVIIRSNMDGQDSYGSLLLNVYPAGGMDSASDANAFAGNIWKGVVESENNYFGDSWRDYWILSKNRNNELKLMHPAGNYLLPNRAYIDAQTVQNGGQNVKQSTFSLYFPTTPNETTDIRFVEIEKENNGTIYNLSGQRMDATQSLPSGIYIKNGKKFFVK